MLTTQLGSHWSLDFVTIRSKINGPDQIRLSSFSSFYVVTHRCIALPWGPDLIGRSLAQSLPWPSPKIHQMDLLLVVIFLISGQAKLHHRLLLWSGDALPPPPPVTTMLTRGWSSGYEWSEPCPYPAHPHTARPSALLPPLCPPRLIPLSLADAGKPQGPRHQPWTRTLTLPKLEKKTICHSWIGRKNLSERKP